MLAGDQFLGFIAGAVILLMIFGAPKQVVRSIRRWWADDEPPPVRVMTSETAALVERMRQLIRPTLRLTSAATPGFSKLGGAPDAALGFVWPLGREGPMAFLGQIDLTEAAAAADLDWLPKSGRLLVFHHPNSGDSADAARIVYAAARPTAMIAAPRGSAPYRERRVAFQAYTLAPSLEWLGLDGRDLDLHPADFSDEFRNAPPSKGPQHRIGGYPDEIQDVRMPLACEHLARGWAPPAWDAPVAPEIERAVQDWRLLFQFDSDPKLRLAFGDGGRLYIFVREGDARAGDFSKTVTIQQSH